MLNNLIKLISEDQCPSDFCDIYFENAFDALFNPQWVDSTLAKAALLAIDGVVPTAGGKYFEDSNGEIWLYKQLSGGIKAFLLLINGAMLPDNLMLPGHYIGDNVWWWICYASNFYTFKITIGLSHVLWLWDTEMSCSFRVIDTGKYITNPYELTMASWDSAHGGHPDTPLNIPKEWKIPAALLDYMQSNPIVSSSSERATKSNRFL